VLPEAVHRRAAVSAEHDGAARWRRALRQAASAAPGEEAALVFLSADERYDDHADILRPFGDNMNRPGPLPDAADESRGAGGGAATRDAVHGHLRRARAVGVAAGHPDDCLFHVVERHGVPASGSDEPAGLTTGVPFPHAQPEVGGSDGSPLVTAEEHAKLPCPLCGSQHSRTMQTRFYEVTCATWRRRECLGCGARFRH